MCPYYKCKHWRCVFPERPFAQLGHRHANVSCLHLDAPQPGRGEVWRAISLTWFFPVFLKIIFQ